MKSTFIIIIAIFFLFQSSSAGAATHEIGFGASYLNQNDEFKKGLGINIHYDFSPKNFLALRTTVSGDFLNRNIFIYGGDGYNVTGSFSAEIKYFILSIEESTLFKTTLNKFEPYIGFGISYSIYNHKMDNNNIYGLIENSFGLNIHGGFKYPLTPILFTYVEAKYTMSINSTDKIVGYTYYSYEGDIVDISYLSDGNINLNRLEIHAGLSFRL